MKLQGTAEVKQRLRAYPDWALHQVYAAFLDGADRVTSWEQANHRWKNRTGQAEALINCRVVVDGGQQTIRLVNAHGVPYGVYLENSEFGRFAILLTALRTMWPSILEDAAARMRRGK